MITTAGRFVAYVRISTVKQGVDGLGADAQRATVERLAASGELLAVYAEQESGARRDRPQLAAAIAHARKERATLLVAKLDRLARDVGFLLALADSGLPIRFGDAPELDTNGATGRLQLTILGGFAEFERRRIAERTRDALARIKQRMQDGGTYTTKSGRQITRLGNPAIEQLAAVRKQQQQAQACARARTVGDVVADLRAEGCTTVRAVCDGLNARNVPSPAGGRWHVPSTHRLLKRLTATRQE